jgi:predicted amidohydrolase
MLTVAAIQQRFFHAHSVADMEACLVAAIRPAVEQGAQLIVLPQHIGLSLLGAAGAGKDPLPVLKKKGAALLKVFEEMCAELAARFSVWLAPGSIVGADGESLVAQAYLFAPDGRMMGRQRQTHLGAQERAWGVARGDSLDVFETPLGCVGLVVGEDVRYPEVARILTLQGADILIHVAAMPAPFDEETWLASLWREVQANQVLGIQACLVGECFGQTYAGRSAILAPVEMTEGRRGILAQSSMADGEQVVAADLDRGALHKVVDGYPIFRYFNYGLYAREFPSAYRKSLATHGIYATEHAECQ